jgi:hypothetical protein
MKSIFRFRWRWGLVVILILILLASLGVIVLADGPLAFLDEEPLIYKLEDPAKPIHVVVKNGGQTVTGLQFRVVALQDAEGTPAGDEVISIRPEPDEVQAFDVGTFTLTLTYQGNLSPGSYNGFLVASVPEVALAQRPFTLEVPEETEEEPRTSLAGLVPQDSEVTISQTLGGRQQESSTTVTLYGTELENLDISAIRPATTILETERGHRAIITLKPEEIVSAEELRATLSLSGVTQPGKYTGTLLLDPMEDPKEGQKLTITALVQDFWVWPWLTIVGGVILAYLVSRWLEEVRPRKQVELWCTDKLDEIKKVEKTAAGGDPDYSIRRSVEKWIDDIKETLDYADVDKAKQNLGTLDDRLEKFYVLRVWTSSLSNRYSELKRTLTSAHEPTNPVAIPVAKQELTGRPIWDWPYENTNLETVSKAIAAADGFLDQFQSLYKFCRELQAEVARLAGIPGPHEPGLDQYRRELRAIHDDLWKAESGEKLKKGLENQPGILVRLKKVEMGLARLPVPPHPSSWNLLAARCAAAVREGRPPEQEQPSRDRPSPRAWKILKEYLTSAPRTFRFVNWLVLLVTLALVTLSGLALLYPGKNFGIWDDYLKAFLWGSVGTGLTDFVKKVAEAAKLRLAA